MTVFSNQLTDAQVERLALLSEKCGEVVAIIGKINRHGYESTHPKGGPTNRETLEKELGQLFYTLSRMDDAEDIDTESIGLHQESYEVNVLPHLHHQQ